MKILIIGGGNMGLTYASSFLRAHIVNTQEMMILEKSEEKAEIIRKKNIGTVFGHPKECMPTADLIILAVKPQDVEALFSQLKPYTHKDQVYLSIMAGIKIDFIQQKLDVTKVIRAMPNLPAQIGMGITVFTTTPQVDRNEFVKVQNLINTTGKSLFVQTEDQINAATAVSGSGPAYVFYFMDAMMAAARDLGFSAPEAELLTWQTFIGAIDLFHKNDLTCHEWIQKVSSKGGTTEAAIDSFNKNDLLNKIKKGMHAACDRAKFLGGDD